MPTTTTVEVYSSSVPAGFRVFTDPPEGTVVDPNSLVTVYISKGPPPATRWSGSNPEVVDAAVSTLPAATGVLLTRFVDLDFPNDRARLNDSPCTISWGGFDWEGMGIFGTVGAISESLEVFAQPVVLTLSGVDADIALAARASQYKGRTVAIYTGILNPRTVAPIHTPEEDWSGYMDYMEIKLAKNLATVTLHCEHRMRRAAKSFRWTDEGHRSRFPLDKGFEHIWRIRKEQGKWGTRDLQYGGGGLGGGSRGHRQQH